MVEIMKYEGFRPPFDLELTSLKWIIHRDRHVQPNFDQYSNLISNSPNSTMKIPKIGWKKCVLPSSGQK